MKIAGERIFMFLIGAFLYSLIEIAARGFTHWTMFIAGGVCLALMYDIDRLMGNMPLGVKCIAGALLITTVEFISGILVNIKYSWNVWDYSDKPLNFMGQICFPYSVGWFFLSFAAYGICFAARRKFSSFPN